MLSWVHSLFSGNYTEVRKFMPYADAMAFTPQDPVYHGEGDVWAHTLMTLQAVDSAAREGGWANSQRHRLMRMTAALHSVCKPDTTIFEINPMKPEEERIRHPGHAALGADRAWRIMSEDGSGDVDRRAVCDMILWHQKTFRMIKEKKRQRWTKILSYAATGHSWRDLIDFARFDTRGRIMEHADLYLENLDALENDVFLAGNHYNLPLLDGGAFFTDVDRVRCRDIFLNGFSHRHPPNLPRLIMLCGIPGAGKSTWAAARQDSHGGKIVSIDDIRDKTDGVRRSNAWEERVLRRFFDEIRRGLQSGREVIADATFLDRKFRGYAKRIADECGARSTILYFDIPIHKAAVRNENRPRPVSKADFDRIAWSLNYIESFEAHDILHIKDDGSIHAAYGEL